MKPVAVDWDDELDRFEAILERQEACVEAGDFEDFPEYEPPHGDPGTVPDDLRERAEALLARSREIETQVAGRLVAAGRQLSVASRFAGDHRGAPAPASYVDREL